MKKIVPVSVSDLGERQILFTISTEVQDRDEDIMIAAGCDFSNYAKNPQFLGFHNYWDYPLGRPISWWIDPMQKSVKAIVYFPTIEELTGGLPQNASEKVKLVDTTYYFYKNKLLNAVSVGFNPKDKKPNPESEHGWGSIISKWELMEFSACPVPSNPGALAEAIKSYDPTGRMGQIFEEGQAMTKGAIPFKHFALADPDTKWDVGEVVKNCDNDDLAIISAWKADKKPEEMTKDDFRLQHHLSKADGYKTVKAAVDNAMARLSQTDLPDEDRPEIEAHLKKHQAEFEEAKLALAHGQKTGARLSADSVAALDEIEKCHKSMKSKMAKIGSLHEDMKSHMNALDEAHAKMKAAIKKLRDGPSSDDGDEPPPKPDSQDDQNEGGDQSVLDITDAD